MSKRISSKLKRLEPDKIDVVIATSKDLSDISKEVYRLNESLGVLREKLDKIIDLLTVSIHKKQYTSGTMLLNKESD